MALVKLEKTLAPVLSPSGRPLRIAQIAPLYESVPPKLYGGTERIVANLVEKPARRRHQVTCWRRSHGGQLRTGLLRLADMYQKAQGTAVRPKRTIHDVALAREAARQWNRVPDGDRFNTRAKPRGRF